MPPNHSLMFVPVTPFQEPELSSPYLKILANPLVLLKEGNTAQVIKYSCFTKRGFPKYGFFSLKMSAYAKKKIDTACFVKVFQVSADEGMGE